MAPYTETFNYPNGDLTGNGNWDDLSVDIQSGKIVSHTYRAAVVDPGTGEVSGNQNDTAISTATLTNGFAIEAAIAVAASTTTNEPTFGVGDFEANMIYLIFSLAPTPNTIRFELYQRTGFILNTKRASIAGAARLVGSTSTCRLQVDQHGKIRMFVTDANGWRTESFSTNPIPDYVLSGLTTKRLFLWNDFDNDAAAFSMSSLVFTNGVTKKTIGNGGDYETLDDLYNGELDTTGDLIGQFLAGAHIIDVGTGYDMSLMSCDRLFLECASGAGPTASIQTSAAAATITGTTNANGGLLLTFGDTGPTAVYITGLQFGSTTQNGQLKLSFGSDTVRTTVYIDNTAHNFGADAGAGTRQLINITGANTFLGTVYIRNAIMACTSSQTGTVSAGIFASSALSAVNGLDLKIYHASIRATNMTRGVQMSAATGKTSLLEITECTVCGASTADIATTGTGTVTQGANAGHNVTSDTSQSGFGSGGTSSTTAAAEWVSSTNFMLLQSSLSRGNGTTSLVATDRTGTVRPQRGFVDAGAMESLRPLIRTGTPFPAMLMMMSEDQI